MSSRDLGRDGLLGALGTLTFLCEPLRSEESGTGGGLINPPLLPIRASQGLDSPDFERKPRLPHFVYQRPEGSRAGVLNWVTNVA